MVVDSRKLSQRKWVVNNRDKYNAYARKYYQDNKQKLLKRCLSYKKNNEEKRRLANKKYFLSMKGKMVRASYAHRRRLKEKGLTKEIVQLVYEQNIKRFGTLTCELCMKPIDFGDDTLEHFNPLSRGGNNDRSNLGIAHLSCNCSKRNKTLEEYLAWL